jgi:hypothetical protein
MAVSNVHSGLFDMSVQLIEASAAAWPEDPLLPIALSEFKKLSPEVAFNLVVDHLGSFMPRLASKDTSALFEASKIPALAALDIETKFTNANASTRDTLWSYIGHICKYISMSKLYKHIPDEVLGAVSDAASGLKARIDAGTLDLSSINPFELGQEVMSKFQPQELEKMMRQLTSNPETMASIMSQMTSVLGPEALSAVSSSMAGAGGSGGAGGIDVASMLKFLPK